MHLNLFLSICVVKSCQARDSRELNPGPLAPEAKIMPLDICPFYCIFTTIGAIHLISTKLRIYNERDSSIPNIAS